MIKTPIDLQELRKRIYQKAKSEKSHRFWGIFVHITKMETLKEAYRIAKRNGGAPGIDGKTFNDIEKEGLTSFLKEIQEELKTGKYKPKPNRKVEIPKENSKKRKLQIPCIKDRVVQGAVKLMLEAIFEADFCNNSYGFRPKRSPHKALSEVRRSIQRRMFKVIPVCNQNITCDKIYPRDLQEKFMGMKIENKDKLIDHLQDLLRSNQNNISIKRVQCIYFKVKYGKKPEEIGEMIGYNKNYVKQIQAEYWKNGDSTFYLKQRGGRRRENLTIKEEKAIVEEFQKRA